MITTLVTLISYLNLFNINVAPDYLQYMLSLRHYKMYQSTLFKIVTPLCCTPVQIKTNITVFCHSCNLQSLPVLFV